MCRRLLEGSSAPVFEAQGSASGVSVPREARPQQAWGEAQGRVQGRGLWLGPACLPGTTAGPWPVDVALRSFPFVPAVTRQELSSSCVFLVIHPEFRAPASRLPGLCPVGQWL